MSSRLLCIAVVLLGSCVAFAQKTSGGGTKGGNAPTPSFSVPNSSQGSQLQVRFSWANERPLTDEVVHVQLLSSSNIPITDTFADHEGGVLFPSVLPGSYRLKVDGPNIEETVTDAFEINYMERMHIERVHVMPKRNVNNASSAAGPPISATELNAPPKAKSEMDKGIEAMGKGDLQKAAEKFQKAVEIYPKYARAWSNLGVVRMKEGDQAGAEEAWQKASDADDRFASGYLNLARLRIREKKLPEAADYVAKAMAREPNSVEALALQSNVELYTGQLDKAIADARRVHGMPHEHMAEVHLVAGQALARENRNAEAAQEFEQYLKEYPDSPQAAQVRAAMTQMQAKKQN